MPFADKIPGAATVCRGQGAEDQAASPWRKKKYELLSKHIPFPKSRARVCVTRHRISQPLFVLSLSCTHPLDDVSEAVPMMDSVLDRTFAIRDLRSTVAQQLPSRHITSTASTNLSRDSRLARLLGQGLEEAVSQGNE